MSRLTVVALGLGFFFLSSQTVFAQAFGEYGRAVGSVGQRQGSASPKAPGGATQKGKGITEGIGGLEGRPVPPQLVVASKETYLYPRQDEEGEKIDHLSQGETLIPMVQSTGGKADWYMVKTQKGAIGWVKASDVREQPGRKP